MAVGVFETLSHGCRMDCPRHACVQFIENFPRKKSDRLLAAGADVNLRDNRGRTALFDALEQGHLSIAKELLRAGARTDIRDQAGMTPLDSIRQQEQSPEMVLTELRIAHGIKVDKTQLEAQAVAWRRLRARMIGLLERHARSRK